MGLFNWFRRRRPKQSTVETLAAPPLAVEHGFAVVDVETTGFAPLKHRILEIAVVRADPEGRMVDEWSTVRNPDGPVGATHVHGITSSDVRHAPRFADIAGELADRLAGRALVGHNATFDLAFIKTEFARAGVRIPEVPVLCTLDASHLYLPDLNRRRLADCCFACGIEHYDAHSALGDAKATARLLRFYLDSVDRDPAHVGMPALAARVSWPPLARRIVELVQRRSGATAPVQAPVGVLAALLEDLPLSVAVEEWAPATTTAYVELLAEVLEDGVLTSDEAVSLAGLAAVYSLSREQVDAAHRGFLLALAHKAIEDGKVTRSERDEILAVVTTLGFTDRIVQLILDEATAALAATRALQGTPIPEGWSHGEPLRVGMAVAFTGCDEVERARLEGRAQAAGLRVTSSVSRRTALLVTDGANRTTRKARDALEYRTRTVAPGGFARLVEHVLPALETAMNRGDRAPRSEVRVEAASPLASVVDLGTVRAWARANGHSVGVRGRVSANLLADYRAAHSVA